MKGTQQQQEMGFSGLGKDLQAQELRRARHQGPRENEQNNGGQNMVEMAAKSARTLGKAMETQVRSRHPTQSAS